MSLHLLIVAMLTSAAPASLPETPDTLFALANHAMSRGAFDEAASGYERLVALGVEDGHVYYNLGNAYVRAGRIGAAIASYLRASALLPRDPDVHQNLAFARKQTKDALAPPEPSPVLRTIFFWHYGLSWRETAAWVAVASLSFWGALALGRLRRHIAPVRVIATAAGIAVAGLVPSFVIKVLAPRRVAVVTAGEAKVHTARRDDAVVRFVLREGAEARLLGTDGDWARIVLADGQQGWVAAAHLAVAEL